MRWRNEGGYVVTYCTMRSQTPALPDMACTKQEPLPGPHMQPHTHTQHLDTVCFAYAGQYTKCKQMIWLCSHTHSSLHFLPPSLLPPSAALSYLLLPIIVPTYGVSSCKPQFRRSEILLSDCHNASASDVGRTTSPPPLSPLTASLHRCSLCLTLSVFFSPDTRHILPLSLSLYVCPHLGI